MAYERVSTARQGASGLGLEAQRQAIDRFAASKGAEVLALAESVIAAQEAEIAQMTAWLAARGL